MKTELERDKNHSAFWQRLHMALAFYAKQLWHQTPGTPITFCVAHFNGGDFLEITLHSIRRYHPKARIIVADSRSNRSQFAAACMVCKKFTAELHPLIGKHSHTGSLNYLFRQIRSKIGVFLDQDCVLLESLNPLLQKMDNILLAGPRDEMRATHPNTFERYPSLKNQLFRFQPEFVHASLMLMNVRRLRSHVGRWPFRWESAWGALPAEPYFGFTERVRRKAANAILWLDSQHTGYGLGTVYLHEGIPVAYHNWLSGRVLDQNGKMDGGVVDVDWLRSEMSRFIKDYRSDALKLDLQ
ncbi:MAG: glycosyltransferase [Verrucomicrobiota bacterium]|jgi:hypothetical protein